MERLFLRRTREEEAARCEEILHPQLVRICFPIHLLAMSTNGDGVVHDDLCFIGCATRLEQSTSLTREHETM